MLERSALCRLQYSSSGVWLRKMLKCPVPTINPRQWKEDHVAPPTLPKAPTPYSLGKGLSYSTSCALKMNFLFCHNHSIRNIFNLPVGVVVSKEKKGELHQ
ncbi:hypothetical protein SLEP1_g11528 [Rubroshorea leprosula]|nr:hypothetical protein SLEP1_g11528 [Rubroshorea leprosula]